MSSSSRQASPTILYTSSRRSCHPCHVYGDTELNSRYKPDGGKFYKKSPIFEPVLFNIKNTVLYSRRYCF